MRWALYLATATALFAADPLYLSTQRKFDLIADGKLRPGSAVTLSSAELNGWARTKLTQSFPQGVRNPELELGSGEASGSLLVDFLKLRTGTGKETSWLISKMIEGERPLKVWIRITSGGGQATVSLTRVDLSNATLSGRTLDFLIENFFKVRYPDAKIGEPFEIGYSIDRIDVQPSGVRVVMK